MCGINGILRLSPDAPPIDRGELIATRDAMAARGPDGCGEWFSPDGRVGLGHRRLAILDLSPAGAQPMTSPSGRSTVILNGEIYNFRELRKELEDAGAVFHTRSDTEVILALWEQEGVAMLSRLRGMFALALWDARGQRLLLARDPLGIKPLYYATEGGLLRFASQVKALAPSVSPEIDLGGLAGFLLWGAVPEPLTLRRAVRALPAGSYLLVDEGEVGEPRTYYCFDGEPARTALAPALAVEGSVAAHLVSDVPVAVFLSAGLDSGLIAALACRHLPEPPLTLTVRFDALAGTPADEGPLAARVARALGTRHVERTLARTDFAGLWDAALAAMDQPSIDGFNTFVVARAAREAGLKVVLSGLGGDELFGSYPSFTDVPKGVATAGRLARVPGFEAVWPPLARRLWPRRPKLAGLVRWGRTLAGSYLLRRGLFLPEELPGLLGAERAAEGLARCPVPEGVGDGDPWVAVHAMETALYMKNQLLRDADWAAMAWSIELRVPLADAVLRKEIAAAGFEPARSRGKAALVRQAAPELPAELFARPKTGFFIPLVEWMHPEAKRWSRAEQSRHLARAVLDGMGVPLQ